MITHRRSVWILLAVILGSAPALARPDDGLLKTIDEYLPAVKTFQQGQDSGPLANIEKIVFTLPADSEFREPIEQKLIAALEAAETDDAKCFLCRQLRVIGTETSIASLEKLLTAPTVSSMAVYALGRMESPQACESLRRALNKTSGIVQAGIINALADRRCEQAKPDLLKLLTSTDPDVARASARALGKLGDADTVQALQNARQQTSGELSLEIDNGLLEAADQLLAAGEDQQAAVIYEWVRKSQTARQYQLAALRGLIQARPGDAAALLVATIRQEDSGLTRDAIALIPSAPGAAATRAFADLLDKLKPDNQVLLLRALGARGDRSASAVIATAAQQPDESVRGASLEALGGAGDANSVDVLLQAAAGEGSDASIARRSLLLVQGNGVDEKLLQILDGDNAAAVAQAARAAAGRACTAAVPKLLKLAKSPQPAVRQESIAALGSLAGPPDFKRMIALAAQSTAPSDQDLLVAAISRVLAQVDGEENRVTPLLDALQTAPDEAKPTFLQLLGKTGSYQARAALRANLKAGSLALQDAAVQALALWPDASVSDDLLDIMRTAPSQPQKEVALQGYIRLANLSDNPTEMIIKVLAQVEQVPDKKLVLAGLGQNADSPAALELALGQLSDPDLAPTAGLAALRIANRLRNSKPDIAREALDQVVKKVDHDDVRQRAQEVINDMDKFEGHILEWMGSGPFMEKGKNGAAIYETVFDPETPDARNVKWQKVTKGIGSWSVNLESAFGGMDHCAAYLRTRVWSPEDQDAQLEMGSDDAVKAWLNGKLAFSQWTEHGPAPRQHQAAVHLNKGWNELLLKVVDAAGGWEVGCRLRKPDGTAPDGLKFSTE